MSDNAAAAIYTRVSIEDQARNTKTSLPEQRAICLAAAQQHGFVVNEQHILVDDGYPSDRLARPGLDHLRDLVRAKAISAVFISDRDRLSREPVHKWVLQQEMNAYNVHLYVGDRLIESTPEGEMTEGMLDLYSKYEITKIRERMRRGRLGKVKAGNPLLGSVPLGYKYIPKTNERHGYLVADPDEVALVNRIFELYGAGRSIRDIVRQLTLQQIPTKFDRLAPNSARHKKTPAGTWHRSSVQKILRNTAYIGQLQWGKRERTEPDATRRRKPVNLRQPKSSTKKRDPVNWITIPIPAIVDLGLFQRVQELLDHSSERNKRRRKVEYLFLNGRLRCGQCGYALSGYMDGNHRWYRCRFTGTRITAPCKARVKADYIEELAWDLVEMNVLDKPKAFGLELERRRAEIATRQEYTNSDLETVNNQLERCERELQRWQEAYAAEVIDLPQFRELKSGLDQRRASLETVKQEIVDRIGQDEQAQVDIEAAVSFVQRVKDELPHYSVAEKRKVLELLGARVIYEAGKISKVSIKFLIPGSRKEDWDGPLTINYEEKLFDSLTNTIQHGCRRGPG